MYLSNMKWEYKKLNYIGDLPSTVINKLNDYGCDGWEIIQYKEKSNTPRTFNKNILEYDILLKRKVINDNCDLS